MANTPKYMDIVNWTIAQIATNAFAPKDKFLSEITLCKKFDCSRQTVRRALEMLESQGYITRIQGSGTYISSSKPYNIPSIESSKPSRVVGFVSTFQDHYIFPNIIRGIGDTLSNGGYTMQLAFTDNQVTGETKALQLMLDKQLAGLIVEPTRSALPCANLDLYHTFIKRGIPLVFIDSFYPELSIPYVALDDVQAGYVATQHLLKMGHRNVLGVFPHNNRQGLLRYLGYVNALTEHGIAVQDDRICWYSKETMMPILHSNQFLELLLTCTGVVCYNDWIALMVIDLLNKNNKNVPDDLSIVGIDNSEMARFSSLTSVAHPAQKLGEAAVNLLLSMINGSEGKNILFQPQLIERTSVKQL